MKFRLIADQRETLPVRVMCDVLGVSPAGYYAWRGRPESLRKTANRALLTEIRRVHMAHRGRYGAPRIYAALRARGYMVTSSAPRLKNRLDFCRKGRIAMGAGRWTWPPGETLRARLAMCGALGCASVNSGAANQRSSKPMSSRSIAKSHNLESTPPKKGSAKSNTASRRKVTSPAASAKRPARSVEFEDSASRRRQDAEDG